MHALIYEGATPGAGAWDIAGRPLLVRQLQWLRDQGISKVVIEVVPGVHARQLSAWLLGSDPLVHDAVIVPSALPLGAAGLAQRAGLAADELVLALPSDTLVQCTLPSPLHPLRYQLAPPGGFVGARIEIAVEPLGGEREPAEPHAGWALRIQSVQEAVRSSWAVLTGSAPGVLIHASEAQPGIWLGRGVQVAASAQLRAPVLVGAFARIGANAEVGPRAIIGAGAVVADGAHIVEAVVAEETLVGDGLRARGSLLAANYSIDLRDGGRRTVYDPLELTSLRASQRPSASSRFFAGLLLAALLLPWLVMSLLLIAFRPSVRRLSPHMLHTGGLGIGLLDVVPRLFDVLLGRRTLVGPSDLTLLDGLLSDAPAPGALDVTPRLCAGCSPALTARLLRWYALNKTPALDRSLWFGGKS